MGSSESQTFNYSMPSPFSLILSVYSAQVNILWRSVDLRKKTSHLKKGNNPFKHKMSLFFSPSNVSIYSQDAGKLLLHTLCSGTAGYCA